MSDGRSFHWDGSPVEAGQSRVLHTLHVWKSSASKTLRRQAQGRCAYCGHAIEYFDRFDGGRIPLVPYKDFRSAQVPGQFHWSVANGIAYGTAGDRGTCRLPHPAVCPMVEHSDDDPELEDVRSVLRVRTRKWIEAGTFVPRAQPDQSEEDVAEQHVHVDHGARRHVVRRATTFWLAPAAVDAVTCVAHVRSTGTRCTALVFDPEVDDGAWEQVEIPAAPGRAGQAVLGADGLMWVWALHPLDFADLQRWIRQRCTVHWRSTTHDAVPPQWVHFNTFHHDQYILRTRPADLPRRRAIRHPLLDGATVGPAKRTICAAEGCRNGSVLSVDEGWLCYKCRPRHQRRETAHRTWQHRAVTPHSSGGNDFSPPEDLPPSTE